MKILLIEDDLDLGNGVRIALSDQGFDVIWVRRKEDALHQLDVCVPELILLDLGLPDGDGMSLMARLRQQLKGIPVIILTARGTLQDRLCGLDAGADDKSPHSDVEVTLFTPASGWNFFIYLNSRGYYILPLLVCFPFLLFPAWLSIRIAMRPWNKVVNEITLRTPDDLSPLKAVPGHRELRQMVDAINDFLARVRESAERERVFIADAAHELRTPLAAMRINVEALQSWVISESQQELLAGVIRSNSRAARLVNQLLLMMHSEARIDTEMETVPLTTLIQERMAELEPLASARRIELEFFAEDDIWIPGVRERLVSLIDNLIENAVKYSPEGGRIQVDVCTSDGFARLRVSDAGPGIPVELRERVFDRFFRDPNQVQSGSGLGLAIVKAVAQQHNSSVNLSTSAEGGLMVTVDFPNRTFC
ncbi:hybrid sensor histidine kinase/response regulator [Enterobacter asburiae]|uniref:hybrid sensor histidine kinase/response regulator n=1 Tax=Enterobacter cloacae complex TaxID=354276 RepID=UPI000B138B20|nr:MULTISPECIES: hybrid sensor histidine kinase/response regulator [Enterobacter cloacae complex]MDI4532974.1 response regulator [Escherichia coli]POV43459.1 two-component sensor histidine kinase [Enterobacter cloacae complex sp. ECNIH11]POV46811.1 two-component sensor histidine kinase [Enterobacter cloacae complex sp. ECNIH16]